LRRWSDVPIVILSARSDEAQKVHALDAGADDYLTKPFGNPELLARIRAHLRRRGRPTDAQEQEYRFGAVLVQFPTRQVSLDGAPLHLTPTEFKLLCALVDNAGKVLTHTFLLRAVWGTGYAERSHYLRIYMARLRQKLERDPARPRHLVTESGVGYRLLI
jgi:two-component system KDP operon response regulator KdpE